ncbi:MAG: hypothetical protein Q6362_011705 [Candidatus Wukongarchaeota archaeon]|nr:hypothetical protein [Candidatus Wukongarchaeota archaeon]MDO8130075.1 hypothetical protein [Candidatus Wukongarchaeota archaeon]
MNYGKEVEDFTKRLEDPDKKARNAAIYSLIKLILKDKDVPLEKLLGKLCDEPRK